MDRSRSAGAGGNQRGGSREVQASPAIRIEGGQGGAAEARSVEAADGLSRGRSPLDDERRGSDAPDEQYDAASAEEAESRLTSSPRDDNPNLRLPLVGGGRRASTRGGGGTKILQI